MNWRPLGTYRNQVGTNLEPNGTSLCMEDLGDGFFVYFCGLWCFWMLFVGIFEFEPVPFGSSFRFKLPVAEHTCCRGECW